MAQAAQPTENDVKNSKAPLILGVVLALVGAGAGFASVYIGLLDSVLGPATQSNAPAADTQGGGHGAETGAAPTHDSAPSASAGGGDVTFVTLEPITINLGERAQSQHLRFAAKLEVAPGHEAEVVHLMPRIIDVLNIYLRALDPRELEEPAALLRVRGQMLRRVQIVTGPGFVNDLLIMEFVFN